jgi:hypothetical protein
VCKLYLLFFSAIAAREKEKKEKKVLLPTCVSKSVVHAVQLLNVDKPNFGQKKFPWRGLACSKSSYSSFYRFCHYYFAKFVKINEKCSRMFNVPYHCIQSSVTSPTLFSNLLSQLGLVYLEMIMDIFSLKE